MKLLCKINKDRIKKILILLPIIFLIIYYAENQKLQFIVQKNEHLYIKNTNHRFRFLGGNHFNLLVKYLLGEFHGLNGTDVFRISSEYKINVIRFWATCSNSYWSDQCLYFGPNNWNNSKDKFFEKFDELVNDAEKYNIYLIPVLVDGFDTFKWVGKGTEVCKVGSEANLEYKKFIREVVTRYKNKPVILAWDIGNEGNLHCSNYNDLLNWYCDTAAFIRELDPNHIISTGENNFGSMDKTNFINVHLNKNITMSSVHIYDRDLYNIKMNTDTINLEDFISYWTAVSHDELKKPIYFGEFGSFNISNNPEFYNDFLKLAYNSDVDGVIFWSWLEGSECNESINVGGMCITPTRAPSITEDISYWAVKFNHMT